MSSDAFHVTSPPPNGEGLARAMTMALEDAGVCPEDVDYVNGHGTGTPANDTAELAVMGAVFGASAPPFSSSKPQLGHTLGAAGVVETAIIALTVRDQVVGRGTSCRHFPVGARPAAWGSPVSTSRSRNTPYVLVIHQLFRVVRSWSPVGHRRLYGQASLTYTIGKTVVRTGRLCLTFG
ncbi:hypothetical protein [Saccharopolyspora sp. ASAGF58]|uniref:hypothetical protein n=1 Tax=Saccharopolyspora sp. ASAGF58 TaxID=2719023 RepID=UPI0014401B58|nr:hypothetical protein FDZ84_37550 [Saccharopolyspora sp. ASAGF58]